MALNFKQMATLGLGLGLATAVGYHALNRSRVDDQPMAAETKPALGRFDIVAAPAPFQSPPEQPPRLDSSDTISSLPLLPARDGNAKSSVAVHDATSQNYELGELTSFETDDEFFTLDFAPSQQDAASTSPAKTQDSTESDSDDQEFQFAENDVNNVASEGTTAMAKQTADMDSLSTFGGSPMAELHGGSSDSAVAPTLVPVAERNLAGNGDEPASSESQWQGNPFLSSPIARTSSSLPNIIKHSSKNNQANPSNSAFVENQFFSGDNQTLESLSPLRFESELAADAAAKVPGMNTMAEGNTSGAMGLNATQENSRPNPGFVDNQFVNRNQQRSAIKSGYADGATPEVSVMEDASDGKSESTVVGELPGSYFSGGTDSANRHIPSVARSTSAGANSFSVDTSSFAPVQPLELSISPASAQRAAHRIEYGKTLSRRGAAFSARQEFLAAMQIVANANDSATDTSRYSQALKKALLAVREAADFIVASPEQQIHMDVAGVIQAHDSQILTAAEASKMSPVSAMKRYFAAAQQQLDIAGGRNVVSAEAFFCMGKLNTILNRDKRVLGPYETAKSVVFHQAALLSDQSHHRSANELGVLLAKNGRLGQAKVLFEQSLISQPTARAWQNLAEAHRRLGEIDFANRANNELQLMASRELPQANSEIQWVPVEQFNADAPVEVSPARVAGRVQQAGKTTPPTNPAIKKSLGERLKSLF